MALQKMTIKRNNNGTVDTLYPTTTTDQLYTADGSTAIFQNDKLLASYLPDAALAGMKLIGVLNADTSVTELTTTINNAGIANPVGAYWVVGGVRDPHTNITGTYDNNRPYVAGEIVIYNGYLYQADENTTGNAPSGGQTNNQYWVYLVVYNNAGQDGSPRIKITGLNYNEELGGLIATNNDVTSNVDLTVEAGDWIICTADGGAGNHTFSVINNTYAYATTTTAGIMSAADKSKLNGIAANANNYSLPLAADGTRGGLQIGYTSTETNRAVVLATEKAYITLPRAIPNLTVNGTAVDENQVNVYAPTSVGSTGQIVQSDGNGAPNWVDYTAIFYDTAVTTSADGTLYFELDA